MKISEAKLSAIPFALILTSGFAWAQAARPTPPIRDPHTPGYVAAKELPDGTIPSPDADGNFIIGPTHRAAPEVSVHEGVPQGEVH